MSELNLKGKMEITTIVQTEDGTLGVVFKNSMSKDYKAIYSPQKHGCFMYLGEYDDNLTTVNRLRSNYDIEKIRFPKGEGDYDLVRKLLIGKFDFSDDFEWDWERNKPSRKKISSEEVMRLLKEKYPDVDEFVLNAND